MLDRDKHILQKMANTIRGLTMDAIDKSNSGHPGLPLGCAEIAAYLYGKDMAHNPANPKWINRDRFVLSAGHGSMLLYAALHLSGYALALDDIKNFRQLHSITPGHPEYGVTPGVEATSGPLGQGFANAVGMALANKMTAALLGMEAEALLDARIFVLCGDGCLMEGITNEAASLAGHLNLDNLIAIYDSNDICLDGPTSECRSEDVAARFKALGWNVKTIDGHSLDEIEKAVRTARRKKGQPSLIVAKTIIGKGAPNKQGKSAAHGAPFGAEETQLAKQNLGLSPEAFHVPADLRAHLDARKKKLAGLEKSWSRKFKAWAAAHSDRAAFWNIFAHGTLPAGLDEQLRSLETKPNQSGRAASNAILQKIHNLVPFLVGGSADLSCSDLTMMKGSGVVAPGKYAARNIKFGVREFAMGAMSSGIAMQGMLRPFCGTFLTFSDYMRNAIRLAAIMQLPVIYQFTHDSIWVGEDGPTHQPVEHIPTLRAIPGLTVFRPADTNEVKAAWSWTLRKAKGPVVLALSRQNLKDLDETNVPTDEGVGRGAYVIKRESNPAEIAHCILATGSEVGLALEVAAQLEEQGKSVRVVSCPSLEIFDAQDKTYRNSVLAVGATVRQYWSIEAQVEQGWHKYIGRGGHAIAMRGFGASAPGKACAKEFGFTAEQILDRMSAGS